MGHFNVYASEKILYAIECYIVEVRRLHGVFDKRLVDHAFLVGNDYGIADMVSYPWIEVYGDFQSDYSVFLHLKCWYDVIVVCFVTQRAYAFKDQVNFNVGKLFSDEERKYLFGKC